MTFPLARRMRALAATLTAGLVGILMLSGPALTISASPHVRSASGV
jgi:hypothetical protein